MARWDCPECKGSGKCSGCKGTGCHICGVKDVFIGVYMGKFLGKCSNCSRY